MVLIAFSFLFMLLSLTAIPIWILWHCYLKASSDQALIRTGIGGTIVAFDHLFSIRPLHEIAIIPTAIQSLRYERVEEPLTFKCGTTVELIADLALRLNRQANDVVRAVSLLGADCLNNSILLHEHFSPAFNDCIETIALQSPYSEFADDKNVFRDRLISNLGADFDGLVLDNVYLHHVKPL